MTLATEYHRVAICRLSGRGVVDFVAKHLDEVLRKEIHFDKSRSVKDCLASAYIITDIQSRKGLVQVWSRDTYAI